MPRQPRFLIPGYPQHVVQRGVDRQAVFFEPADQLLYLESLGKAACEHDCLIHAYVLMTNHVHLLVTPARKDSLPLFMQAIGRRYVQIVNKKHERTGTLWEGRYKASLVQNDYYVLACHRYIELNPVRGGLTRTPGEYRWSSYAHNAAGRRDELLTAHPAYLSLGSSPVERRKAYRRLFSDVIDPKLLTTIRETTSACRVLGDNRFKRQIERVLGRSVEPGKGGRPKSRRA